MDVIACFIRAAIAALLLGAFFYWLRIWEHSEG